MNFLYFFWKKINKKNKMKNSDKIEKNILQCTMCLQECIFFRKILMSNVIIYRTFVIRNK